MNKLLLIWIVVLLTSCITNQENARDTLFVNLTDATDSQSLKLSDFGNTVRYVPLETNEVCLIGNNPHIALLEDKIVIATKDQCFLFHKQTGKYICSIGHIGDDPSSTNYWIDDAGLFYFFRAPDQLLKYNQKGEMTGKIQIPHIPAAPDFFAFSDSTIIAHCNSSIGLESSNSLLFLNSFGEKLDSIPNLLKSPSIPSPDNISSLSIIKRGAGFFGNLGRRGVMIIKDKEQGELLLPLYNPSLWSSENEVRFRETFTDTIYTIKNRKLYPYMVFHTDTDHSSANPLWYSNPQSIYVAYVLENTHSVFFQYVKNKQVYNGLYNKETQQTKFAKCQQFIVDDLTSEQELKVDLSALCSYKGEYGFILEAASIPDASQKQSDNKNENIPHWMSQLDEDANPVIAIVSDK